MTNNIVVIPDNIREIMQTLENSGFKAWAVGGCMRDSLIGRNPKDWDLCTNALPNETMQVFSGFQVLPTGLQHGTVMLVVDGEVVEITTLRIDGDYSDGRRPDNVEFTDDIIIDLSRRDLTINAMAVSLDGVIVDPFGGIDDLEAGIIRTVGKAEERFEEDGLRILRVFRFAERYDFSIEKNTYEAIKNNVKLLEQISAERISAEFCQIISGKNFITGIMQMYNTGVMGFILPEFCEAMNCHQNNPHHIYMVGTHTLASMEQVEGLILRLAMLFHDLGKPSTKITDEAGIDQFLGHAEKSAEIAESWLRRMRFDNDTISKVVTLVKIHDADLVSKKAVKRFLNKHSFEILEMWSKVRRADVMAQSGFKRSEKLMNINKAMVWADEICEANEAFSIKDLAVNGHDIMKLGFSGVMVGKVLDAVMNFVIDNPNNNNKTDIIQFIKDNLNM